MKWSLLVLIALVLFLPPLFSSQKIIEITPALAQTSQTTTNVPQIAQKNPNDTSIAKTGENAATGQINAKESIIGHVAEVKKADIEAYVKKEAKRYGVNPEVATWIIQHESQWNPSAVGDRGTSFGLVQIHLSAHPDVSKENALDYKFAVTWMMQEIVKGRLAQWSSARFCYQWYLDCSL